MGGSVPKQFLALGGQPLILHSLRVLQTSSIIEEVILAVPQNEMDYCLKEIVAKHRFTKVTKVVPGGHERQDSVRHALEAVHDDVDVVLVHDAVRPFLTEHMVEEVVKAARAKGAAIIAVPMKDTVKQVGVDHVIERTIDRQSLWLAQTPQAFRRDWLLAAHRKAHAEGVRATDDAYLIEWAGHTVCVVEGSGENIKVTRSEDLVIGEAILALRQSRGMKGSV
ncbi:MAG: 2-C-methyl-D-erythritol 4-phosphate cytidylyltransferase [Nitrospira sp.]